MLHARVGCLKARGMLKERKATGKQAGEVVVRVSGRDCVYAREASTAEFAYTRIWTGLFEKAQHVE